MTAPRWRQCLDSRLPGTPSSFPSARTRYDLVIDDGEALARVQCKTGRLRGGAIVFAVTSTYGHHRNPATARRTYNGEIDFFAV